LLAFGSGRGVGVFFYDRLHLIFSFGGDQCGHDMDHSGWLEMQGNSARSRKRRLNGAGDSLAAPKMSSDVLR
jgi:hypothetical protein